MLPKVHYKDKLYQSNHTLYSFLEPVFQKACFKKPQNIKIQFDRDWVLQGLYRAQQDKYYATPEDTA